MASNQTAGKTLLLAGFLEQEHLAEVAQILEGNSQHLVVSSHANTSQRLNRPHTFVATGPLHDVRTVPQAFSGIGAVPLDAGVLARFESHRVPALRAMDRVQIAPTSIREADVYLYTLLQHWLGFLRSQQPRIDAAFFASIPHFSWDIVLDFALREVGTPRRYIRDVPLSNLVYIGKDFDGVGADKILFDSSEEFLAHPSLQEEGSLAGNRELARSRATNNVVDEPSLRVLMRRLIYVASRSIIYGLLGRRGNLFGSPYFRLGALQYSLLAIRKYRRHLQTLTWIKSNAVVDVPAEPFVLFALHMQPERTTTPESGHFTHQVLAIGLLSAAVPPGTRILVKEHPAQFRSQLELRKLHARDLEFYMQISRLPNVCFAPIESDSRELAKKSVAVASCKGSILWESLLLGRVAISFASTWHSSCVASPFCDSVEAVEVALALASQLSEEEVRASVGDFIEGTGGWFVEAPFIAPQWEAAGRPREVVWNLANALLKSVSQPS